MRTIAVHAAELRLGGQRLVAEDGALLIVIGVEPGDRFTRDRIAARAAADIDESLSELGAEAVVLLPLTHGELGPREHRQAFAEAPAPLPAKIREELDAEAVVVRPDEYPDLSLSGTVHPTALTARRYDGATDPPEQSLQPDFGALEAAGLVDDTQCAWTPSGLFLRDELLDRVRSAAIEAGAIPQSGRTGGFPSRNQNGAITYGVCHSPSGPQPELASIRSDRSGAIEAMDRFASVIDTSLGLMEADLQVRIVGGCRETRARIEEVFDPIDTSGGTDRPEHEQTADEHADRSVRTLVTDDSGIAVAWAELEDADGDRWEVHCAPIGRFGHTVGSLYDGDHPILPTALAPTQLRLVPIDERHEPRCLEITERLSAEDLRVDIDDRDRSVGRRLEALRTEGVPFYAVVGDGELGGDELPLADRSRRTQRTTETDAVPDRIDTHSSRERYGPRMLSDRP